MEHILEPDSTFDFSALSFVSPTSLNGGNYFIRILNSLQNPLYVQPPKCFLKQGILKTGKKLICDLVFQPQDESFLEFLETLENFCQEKIFNNREKWFEPGLSKVDIENCFASPCKTYKSGKFHSLRTNIPVRMGKCNLKIFDEQEQEIPLEEMKENTNVMTIIEVQGIRCSMRNFQLEFEIKQMMMIKPIENVFEKFMFSGKNLGKKKTLESTEIMNDPVPLENSITEDHSESDHYSEPIESATIIPVDESKTESLIDNNTSEDAEFGSEPQETNIVLENSQTGDVPMGSDEEKKHLEEPKDNLEEKIIVDSPNLSDTKPSLEEDDDLCEVTLDIPNDEEDVQEIKLKNPNEVYYEMYKEAKRKAQIARDLAISSYLTAKQIKHNYLSEETFSDEEMMDQEEKELKEMDLEKEDANL